MEQIALTHALRNEFVHNVASLGVMGVILPDTFKYLQGLIYQDEAIVSRKRKAQSNSMPILPSNFSPAFWHVGHVWNPSSHGNFVLRSETIFCASSVKKRVLSP